MARSLSFLFHVSTFPFRSFRSFRSIDLDPPACDGCDGNLFLFSLSLSFFLSLSLSPAGLPFLHLSIFLLISRGAAVRRRVSSRLRSSVPVSRRLSLVCSLLLLLSSSPRPTDWDCVNAFKPQEQQWPPRSRRWNRRVISIGRRPGRVSHLWLRDGVILPQKGFVLARRAAPQNASSHCLVACSGPRDVRCRGAVDNNHTRPRNRPRTKHNPHRRWRSRPPPRPRQPAPCRSGGRRYDTGSRGPPPHVEA